MKRSRVPLVGCYVMFLYLKSGRVCNLLFGINSKMKAVRLDDEFSEHPVRGECQVLMDGDTMKLQVRMNNTETVFIPLSGGKHVIDEWHYVATSEISQPLETMFRQESLKRTIGLDCQGATFGL